MSEDPHGGPWLDIRELRKRAWAVAKGRHDLKMGWDTTSNWHPFSHYVGCIGEFMYGEATGQEVNESLTMEGDVGWDFPDGVDVKTAMFWSDPDLKFPVRPDGITDEEEDARWPPRLCLVAINKERLRAKIIGVVDSEAVRYSGDFKDYGNGMQHVLNWRRIPAWEGMEIRR